MNRWNDWIGADDAGNTSYEEERTGHDEPYRGPRLLNPLLGDRLTYSIGSDRYAVTVVERTARRVMTRDDKSQRLDEGLRDTGQRWISVPNPEGAVRYFTLRDDGRWLSRGLNCGLLSAGSHPHIDPNF